MTEKARIPPDPEWIRMAKDSGLFVNDFVPFRVFDRISGLSEGSPTAHWKGWSLNQRGKLQQFSSNPQPVEDWIVLGNEDREQSILGRLNVKEEEEYRKRIQNASVESLVRQQELWKEFELEERFASAQPEEEVRFAPSDILETEIQKRNVIDTQKLQQGVFGTPKDQSRPEYRRSLEYSPNRKYQNFHHRRFRKLWDEERSQSRAYDRLVEEFPTDLAPDKMDSYLVEFRKWNKDPKNQ